MKNIIKFLAVLFLITHASSITPYPLDSTDYQIVQISYPKAGTHLLGKCITLLTGKTPVSKNKQQKFIKSMNYDISFEDLRIMTSLPSNEFLKTHLFYSKEREEFLSNNHIIKFFMYRDPRDQIVSFAFYMIKHKHVWPKASTLSFDELLMDMITEGSVFDGHPPVQLNQFYHNYLSWMTMKDMLCIRFEDLVGNKGGGSDEAQKIAITKIIQHLGINPSAKKINKTIENLFGGSTTFRKGQIGAWKKYFKPEHIEAFKVAAGDILIALGYEKDMNW